MYIYNRQNWPLFKWDSEKLMPLLAYARNRQGMLLGNMRAMGFELRDEANLEILTEEIVKSTEIEGQIMNRSEVRSSIARHLGLEVSDMIYSTRDVDGAVEVLLDATSNYELPLTSERLFGWHNLLFPMGRSDMYEIVAGRWRDDSTGPMQVVSGALGRQRVHYQAPAAEALDEEMRLFLDWVNMEEGLDPVLKAGVAHLWFVTIHPFEDGNGRMARAITDMLLARSDGQAHRFYSMSAQIRKERNAYYDVLERTQKGRLDITRWLEWFLNCLIRSIEHSEKVFEKILFRHDFWLRNADVPLNERQQKVLVLLLDDFFGVLNTRKWAKIANCSQDTALRDIQDLIEKGVLRKGEAGGRSTNYELVV